ncbi:MAG: nucleotidyltransferase domain-containing protein [Thiohalocapsa sp.]|jgi:predicted nucleotidyltransferase|uniref:nucleotidyltransferase family protein n=1 Tax=Thiohalocapsa sp. TaxID=2497641 RepID=UPI0025DCE618|nr:nucleotidyltransferase domain-containing protein [Thiohalocapsa sp.]MCG6940587.1 nucleotidyltransferase domain-containing protein [Thiohalocapsa sp.]
MSLPITSADTARHLRRRAAAEQAAADARAARLHGLLPLAVHCLRDAYGAERVVLFGSLAVGDHRVSSDVDLAASGVPGVRYFSALADLMTIFNGPVDLIRLEEAPPSLAERIDAEGIEL